jgi:hypothetical protein
MKYVAALLFVITAVMANYLYEDYKADENRAAKFGRRETQALVIRQETDPENIKVFEETKAKAESGDPIAQYSLGRLYAHGNGVAKNVKMAVDWWRTSAIQGNKDAQVKLALYYTENNEEGRKNLVESAKFFRMAARQSDQLSLRIMAEYYENGSGVVKDDIEAYAYYTLSSIRTGRKGYYHEKLEKRMTKEEILAGLKRAKELQKEIPE